MVAYHTFVSAVPVQDKHTRILAFKAFIPHQKPANPPVLKTVEEDLLNRNIFNRIFYIFDLRVERLFLRFFLSPAPERIKILLPVKFRFILLQYIQRKIKHSHNITPPNKNCP